MASDERTFKTELLHAAKMARMHAVALSPEYNKGTPDVYIKSQGYPGTFVELKYLKSKNRKISITLKQRMWASRERAAGGIAAFAICVKTGPTEWQVYISKTGNVDYITDCTLSVTRRRGESWDVAKLIDDIKYCD